MEADPIPHLVPRFGSDPVSTEVSLLSPSSSSRQPRRVGAALMNLGNTCFLNAVLQCLTHTVPLVERIIDSGRTSCCCAEEEKFCSFLALKDHIEHSLVAPEDYVSPRDIAENLSKISPGLQLGQQEDAHEFLQSLLDAVHTCCHNCTSKNCPSTLDEDSIVKQVFGGRLKSQLRCCSCGHCSDTYEPLFDLSLEIGDANNILDALTSFTKVEKFEDDVKLTCDGCKDRVSMEKQLKLERAPEVLALHLKRFESNGLFSNKISKHVEYPLELDLNQFLVGSVEEVELKYDLYAVVVHLGSSYSGHYFSFIRSSETTWYQMDDTEVTKVSETQVLDQTAYILFYIKKGSCWFSSLLESEKIKFLEKTAHTSPTSVFDYIDSDNQLNSAQELGCSTSEVTPYKWKSNRKDNFISPTNLTTDTSPVRKPRYEASNQTSELSHTDVAKKVSKDESRVQFTIQSPVAQSRKRTLPEQYAIEMFADEPLEDDEEEAIFPQIQVVPKVRKCTVAKPAFEAIKDERMVESFNRSLKGMPRSRRDGLLACIALQNRSSEKHPPTRIPIGNKRGFY